MNKETLVNLFLEKILDFPLSKGAVTKGGKIMITLEQLEDLAEISFNEINRLQSYIMELRGDLRGIRERANAARQDQTRAMAAIKAVSLIAEEKPNIH